EKSPHDAVAARYQTLHTGSRTIGWPALHANASLNCGIFETTPLMRYSSGECGLVMAFIRLISTRSSPQAHWAKPTKKRCCGVSPSIDFRFCPRVAFFQAM